MTTEPFVEVDPDVSDLGAKFYKYRKIIGLAFVGVSLILSLVIRYTMGSSKAELEFQQAQEVLNDWEKSLEADPSLLNQLGDSMKRHPELATKLGSSIAQLYLTLGLRDEASEYRKYHEEKKLQVKKAYTEFTRGTYLIADGRYDEALNETQDLRAHLNELNSVLENKEYGGALYAFTLLRLASLHKELQNRDEELTVWAELKTYLNGHEEHGEVIQRDLEEFLGHFTEDKISLFDYISARENLLK
ncbi:MAG: hypothetical protein MRY21_00665 [Simkaniaceae bacterium]|nr:hypothetical protein [Simkaniaceae bacterium]